MPRITYANGSPVPIQSKRFLGTISYEANRTQKIDVPLNLQIPEFQCVLKVETLDAGGDAPILTQEGYLALIRSVYMSVNNRTPKYKIDGRGLFADMWRNEFRAPVISGLNGGIAAFPTAGGGFEISFTMSMQIPVLRESSTFLFDTRQDANDQIFSAQMCVDWGTLNDVFVENAASRNIKSVSLDVSYIESIGSGLVVSGRQVRANQYRWEHVRHAITAAGEQVVEIPRVENSQLVEALVVSTNNGQPWNFNGLFKQDRVRINHGTDYVLTEPTIDDLRDQAQKDRSGANIPNNIFFVPFYPLLDVAGNQNARSLTSILPDDAFSEALKMSFNVRGDNDDFAGGKHFVDMYFQYATIGNLA